MWDGGRSKEQTLNNKRSSHDDSAKQQQQQPRPDSHKRHCTPCCCLLICRLSITRHATPAAHENHHRHPCTLRSPSVSLHLTFASVSTADVIRRPGARAREERLSEELANPDETTGATKADAQSSAAAAATQAATTFIIKLDCVVLLYEVVGSALLREQQRHFFFYGAP